MCLRRCVLVTNIHKLDSQLARYFDDGCANFLDSLRPAANTKKLWRQNGCWRRVIRRWPKSVPNRWSQLAILERSGAWSAGPQPKTFAIWKRGWGGGEEVRANAREPYDSSTGVTRYVSVYVLRASRDWLPLIAYSNFMCILHDKLPEKYAATFEAPLQPPSSQSCLFELAAAALRICFLAAWSASQQLLIVDFWALILRESRQRKIYR